MKFVKSEIMKLAWRLHRQYGINMSTALRSAWAQAKAVNEAADWEGYYAGQAKVSVNVWEKYGRVRAYVSCKHYTNAWNLKHETKIGYIDILAGEFIAA